MATARRGTSAAGSSSDSTGAHRADPTGAAVTPDPYPTPARPATAAAVTTDDAAPTREEHTP